MKKILLGILLIMLSSFLFPIISHAGQCIFLYNWKGNDYYYNPAEVTYSGNLVSFTVYKSVCSPSAPEYWDLEIDCAKRMIREYLFGIDPGDWESIRPGSFDELYLKKLCK